MSLNIYVIVRTQTPLIQLDQCNDRALPSSSHHLHAGPVRLGAPPVSTSTLPPVRDGYGLTSAPTSFPSLRFSPLGLYDLRRQLGVLKCQPTIFNANRARFLASDVAWFTGGKSTDGRHLTNGFFPRIPRLV
ncbi:hypothetical protein B0H10DRAFT_2200492 [Mycena sp. CBHHK59/15]|nr:hypothetical protein B0H10DRAFT_2200492 [Mycena sp. CBHHK59/15]